MLEIRAAPDAEDRDGAAFAACLASVLELDREDVPLPAGADPLMVWRQWLGGRGWGLVAAGAPEAFGWAGYWIARLAAPDGTRPAVVMFGAPDSAIVWDPLARRGADADPVLEAFVLAPLEPVPARVPAPAEAASGAGQVLGLFAADRAEAPMRALASAEALPGRGLEGDRYAARAGTFSAPGSSGNDVTLIAAEALALPDGSAISAEESRRNVLTAGIDLDGLIGRRFRLGAVECIGRRRCEPCAHLQRLTRPGVLRGLVHRGGLRADVLTGGVVRIGDVIRPLD